jgi:hypothetical protein
MDLLFGTSKKKEEPPKVDINAPTLSETSQKVLNFFILFFPTDGRQIEGHLGKSWRMQSLAQWDQKANGRS